MGTIVQRCVGSFISFFFLLFLLFFGATALIHVHSRTHIQTHRLGTIVRRCIGSFIFILLILLLLSSSFYFCLLSSRTSSSALTHAFSSLFSHLFFFFFCCSRLVECGFSHSGVLRRREVHCDQAEEHWRHRHARYRGRADALRGTFT